MRQIKSFQGVRDYTTCGWAKGAECMLKKQPANCDWCERFDHFFVKRSESKKENTMHVICGGGGFIGGHLAKAIGIFSIRAVDKKPLDQWYQKSDLHENFCLDLSNERMCQLTCDKADVIYQLAADMGGMGFIERHRVECMRSVLINVHMLEAAYKAGVRKYFFSSSACAYNIDKQQEVTSAGLKESDAYPANAERGYGWEKLYSELMAQEYVEERDMEIYIARFHNVYGPNGTWRGGREKAPAAICRKVAEAVITGSNSIDIWGDGTQVRTYMWIDDCIEGIQRIMAEPLLVGVPINLGSDERITVNEIVDLVEGFAGVKLERRYQLDAPRGVVGRASDNTFIKEALDGWAPSTPFAEGLAKTYAWIFEQVKAAAEGRQVID